MIWLCRCCGCAVKSTLLVPGRPCVRQCAKLSRTRCLLCAVPGCLRYVVLVVLVMLYLVLEPIHLTQNTHVDLPLVTQASAKTTGGRELWELTLVVVEPYYPGIAQDTTTTPSSSSSSSSSTATPTSTTTTSTTNKTSASDSKKPAGANGFQVVVADPVVAPPPTAT